MSRRASPARAEKVPLPKIRLLGVTSGKRCSHTPPLDLDVLIRIVFLTSALPEIRIHRLKDTAIGAPPLHVRGSSGVARIFPRGRPTFMGPQGNPYQKLEAHRIWFTIFWEGAQNHEQGKKIKKK